jgi:hypothetical protein
MEIHGPRLTACGYPIVSIMPGSKAPGHYSKQHGWRPAFDWQKRWARTATDSELFCWSQWPDAGVGVPGGLVGGADLDVEDQGLVDALERVTRRRLGDTPVKRIGRAPKCLLVYRLERPFRGIKRHPIEFLAHGQQFVAYATHPTTGHPYSYPHDSLDATDISELPVVSEAQVQEVMAELYGIIPPELRRMTFGAEGDGQAHAGNPDKIGTVAAVKRALHFIPNIDANWDEWVKIGMAIKGALGEAGRDLFLDWSASSSKDVPAETVRAWAGFRPTQLGAGTLYALARKTGWNPGEEPHLILNGAMAEAVDKVKFNLGGPAPAGGGHAQEGAATGFDAPWPDPEPLLEGEEPDPYPVDALPPVMREAVLGYHEYGQQPVEMIACSALSAASLACQGLVDVQRDAHLVGPVSLNVVVIAESGERKTSADKRMRAGLLEWQRAERELQRPELERQQTLVAAWKAEREGILQAIKAARAGGGKRKPDPLALDALTQELVQLDARRPAEPMVPTLFLEDATPEALALRLGQGWPSASVWSDEGGTVVGGHGMSEDSVLRYLALLNRFWDGGTFDRSRAGSNSVEVKGRRLTVSLMMQRVAYEKLLAAGGGAARGTGMLARALVCSPFSTMGTRLYKPMPASLPALAAWNARLRELISTPLPLDPEQGLQPYVLPLGREAFAVWRAFHDDVERELCATGEFADIKDIAAKAAENAARLAAIFHVLEHGPAGCVGAGHMEAGARVALWHIREARRLTSAVQVTQEQEDAQALAEWLHKHREDGAPTLQKVAQGCPHRLRRDKAIGLLERRNVIRCEVVDGRTVLVLNPKWVGAAP